MIDRFLDMRVQRLKFLPAGRSAGDCHETLNLVSVISKKSEMKERFDPSVEDSAASPSDDPNPSFRPSQVRVQYELFG